jgi:hypothetical protein
MSRAIHVYLVAPGEYLNFAAKTTTQYITRIIVFWDAGRRSSCPLGACLFDMWDTSILGFQVGNFKVLFRQEIEFCCVSLA